jgi:hypothetical protein
LSFVFVFVSNIHVQVPHQATQVDLNEEESEWNVLISDQNNEYDVTKSRTFNSKPPNPTALLISRINVYSLSEYAATGQGCACAICDKKMRNNLYRL